ncbi:MAG: hypothetical protein JEZ06_04000 [Anaerolineaceae bacterium]|nr:hypothetical protein [Anaerolineaceae bacterium]
MEKNFEDNKKNEELANMIDQIMAGETVQSDDEELMDIIETVKRVKNTVKPHNPRAAFAAQLRQQVLSELPQPKPAFGERFQEVIAKLLGDEQFRSSFFSTPEKTLLQAGFQLSASEIAALKEMEPENMDEWFGDLDERISKSSFLSGLDVDEPEW